MADNTRLRDIYGLPADYAWPEDVASAAYMDVGDVSPEVLAQLTPTELGPALGVTESTPPKPQNPLVDLLRAGLEYSDMVTPAPVGISKLIPVGRDYSEQVDPFKSYLAATGQFGSTAARGIQQLAESAAKRTPTQALYDVTQGLAPLPLKPVFNAIMPEPPKGTVDPASMWAQGANKVADVFKTAADVAKERAEAPDLRVTTANKLPDVKNARTAAEYVLNTFGSAAGSILPLAATAVATGPYGSVPMLGSLGIGSIRDAFDEAGVDWSKNEDVLYPAAAVYAGLEYIPGVSAVKALLKGGAKEAFDKTILQAVIRGFARGGAREGATEALQTATEITSSIYAHTRDVGKAIGAAWDDVLKGMDSKILESGIQGWIGGGLFDGAARGAQRGQQVPQQPPPVVPGQETGQPQGIQTPVPVAPPMVSEVPSTGLPTGQPGADLDQIVAEDPQFAEWLRTMEQQQAPEVPAMPVDIAQPAPVVRPDPVFDQDAWQEAYRLGTTPAPGEPVVSATVFAERNPAGEPGIKTLSINGETVSAATVNRDTEGNLVITRVDTLPGARRQGYATQLIDDLLEEFPGARIATSAQTDVGRPFFARYATQDGLLAPRDSQEPLYAADGRRDQDEEIGQEAPAEWDQAIEQDLRAERARWQEGTRPVRTESDPVEQETRRIMQEAAGFEASLRQRGLPVEAIAAEMSRRYKSPVTPEAIQSRQTWWSMGRDDQKFWTPARSQQLGQLYRERKLGPAEVASILAEDAGRALTPAAVTAQRRNLAIPANKFAWTPDRAEALRTLHGTRMKASQIARRLSDEFGVDLTPQAVRHQVSLMGLSRKRSAVPAAEISSMRSEGRSVRDIAAGLTRRLGQSVSPSQVARVIAKGNVAAKANPNQEAILEALGNPDIAAMSNPDAAAALSEQFDRPISRYTISRARQQLRRRQDLDQTDNEPMYAIGSWKDWFGLGETNGQDQANLGRPGRDGEVVQSVEGRGQEPASGQPGTEEAAEGRGDGQLSRRAEPRARRVPVRGGTAFVAERVRPDGLRERNYYVYSPNTVAMADAGASVEGVPESFLRGSIGNWWSRAKIVEQPDGSWRLREARTRRDRRGAGLGTDLHRSMEADVVSGLMPQREMTADDYRWWRQRDPESVRDYVKFDEMFYDPAVLREMKAAVDQIALTPILQSMTTAEKREIRAAQREAAALAKVLPDTASLDDSEPLFAIGRDRALTNLRKGIPVAVDRDTRKAVHAALEPLVSMTPDGTSVGTLKRVDPGEVAEFRGRPDRKITLTLEAADGTEFTVPLWLSLFGELRAFRAPATITSHGQPAIVFLPMNIGSNGGQTLGGEYWHELIHDLRERKIIEGVTWDRLVRHANDLSVLDTQFGTYMRMVGGDGKGASANNTLRTEYARLYHNRPAFDEKIDQESVAHMVELAFHGSLSEAELAPIRDILDGIAKGNLVGNRVVDASGPLFSLRSSDEIDAATGQSMRRDLDNLGFYSKALESARALKQEKGTPEQMLAQLKKAGVKDAEIEATGLATLFKEKAGSTTALESDAITPSQNPQQQGDRTASPTRRALLKQISKSEIVKHLEENRVGLREVRYGTAPEMPALTTEGSSYYRNMNRRRESAQAAGLADAPKWQRHSLDPSNPTYRETVLHLPVDMPDQASAQSRVDALRASVNEPGISFEEMLSRRRAADAAASEMSAVSSAALKARQIAFESGHFPEPNIIGHMMTSMVKHEGKDVYNIDQIQFDWYDAYIESVRNAVAQKMHGKKWNGLTEEQKAAVSAEIGAMRQRGEALPGVKDEAKITELKAKIEAKRREADAKAAPGREMLIASDMVNDAERVVPGAPWERIMDWLGYAKRVPGANELSLALLQLRDDIVLLNAELRNAEASAPPPHPLASTLDQSLNTTLRRAIRQAAEAGADYIAVPHGDTVLSYNPGGEDGMRGFYGKPRATPERIAELKEDLVEQEAEAEAATGVRRENAERRIEAIKKQIASAEAVVEGIVPKNLRKLLSTLDKDTPAPVKVKTVEATDGPRGWNRKEEYPFDKSQTGFTLFPLTDKVRQSVLEEGQPMFAMRGDPVLDRDLRDAAAQELANMREVKVPKRVVREVQNEMMKHVEMMPPDQTAGVLVSIKPLAAPSATGVDALAIFQDTDGNLFDVRVNAATLLNMDAVYVSDLGAIAINPLSGAKNAIFGLRGKLGHELVHSLRSDGHFAAPDWSRLVAHGNLLDVLGMSNAEFRRITANQSSTNQATRRAIYDRIYATRKNKAEIVDQETVAHMTQLYVHGHWTDEQIAPVREILDSILDGSYVRKKQGPVPAALDRRPDQILAALDRDNQGIPSTPGLDMSKEARLERAREMGFDTGKVWYHGTGGGERWSAPEDENGRIKLQPPLFDAFSDAKIGSRNDSGHYGRGHYLVNSAGEASYYGQHVSAFYARGRFLDLDNNSGDLTRNGHFKDWAPKLDAIGALGPHAKQSLQSLMKVENYIRDNATVGLGVNRDGSEGYIAKVEAPPGLRDRYKFGIDSFRGRFHEKKEDALEALTNRFIDDIGQFYPDQFPGLADIPASLSDYVRVGEVGASALSEKAKAAGYDGISVADELVVFNPINIRSTQAAFDPSLSDSPQLMAAFAGRNAKTANLELRDRAEQMEKDGFSRADIWSETGWFKHDGRWFEERDDREFARVGVDGRLSNVASHPTMFKDYPELGNIPVGTLPAGGKANASYTPKHQAGLGSLIDRVSGRTSARINITRSADKEALLEEIQHAIDDIEGGFKNVDPKNPYGGPVTAESANYVNAPFEQLARAAVARINMTPEERRARPPWLDFKVQKNKAGSAKQAAPAAPAVSPTWFQRDDGVEVLPERAHLEDVLSKAMGKPIDKGLSTFIDGMKGEALTPETARLLGTLTGLAESIAAKDPASPWAQFGQAVEAYRAKAQLIGHNQGPPTTEWDDPFVYSFAGRNAKTADLAALDRAKEMDSLNLSREDIWKETGWFKGVDGEWRFEIDDSGAYYDPDAQNDLKQFVKEDGRGFDPIKDTLPLGGVMGHKQLYAAYPDMADMPTHFFPKDRLKANAAYSDAKGGRVTFRDDITEDEGRSFGLHEMQHAVQKQEGFARGGNEKSGPAAYNEISARINRLIDGAGGDLRNASPEVRQQFEALKAEQKSLPFEPREYYKRMAGETEARTVQKRMDMKPDERKSRPPWLDYDVPEDQQIVSKKGGTSLSIDEPQSIVSIIRSYRGRNPAPSVRRSLRRVQRIIADLR